MQTVFKNDKEFEEFKTWTLGVLHDASIKDLCVTFTKQDGSERAMRCTLVESNIPTDKIPKTTGSPTTSNGSAVRVFDTEKSEWRSFRWESVTKVEFTL
jgi:WYL_2, Sm-like SH3 beta-barrel fold